MCPKLTNLGLFLIGAEEQSANVYKLQKFHPFDKLSKCDSFFPVEM